MKGSDAMLSEDDGVLNGHTSYDKGSPPTTHRGIEDRVFRTICLCVCFAVMGLASPLLGNTIVHLEHIFEVDTATMSTVFTVHAIGYLSGAIVCGLVFDHVNHELAFATANLVEGLATIVAPFSGSLTAFIAVMCVQATAQGFLDASGQSYSVGLWTGHCRREPILQAIHAIWPLGGMISPFIIARFLVELPSTLVEQQSQLDIENVTSTSTQNESLALMTDLLPSLSANWNQTTATPNDTDAESIAKVRYAYVVIGSLILVATILFVIAYIRGHSRRAGRTENSISLTTVGVATSKSPVDDDDVDRDTDPLKSSSTSSKNQTTNNTESAAASSTSNDRVIFFTFIALMFLFYHLYLYVEAIPISYLTTFTVKYLNFSVQNASLLMSVFFGFHFAGRLLGIPLSTVLRPRTMVIIDLSMTAVAYLLMLAFVNVWPAIVWPSAALAGFSMGTTFAATILWIDDQKIAITGRIASVFLVGSSLGGVIGPLIVGRLFQSSTPMWFVYVIVMASVGHVVLFLGLLLYVRRFGARLAVRSVTVNGNGSKSRSSLT